MVDQIPEVLSARSITWRWDRFSEIDGKGLDRVVELLCGVALKKDRTQTASRERSMDGPRVAESS